MLPRAPRISEDLREMPVVEVVWRDACTDNGGWQSYKEVLAGGAIECRTVGFLAANTKRHIKVSPTIAENGNCGTTWTIPKDWVHSMRVLKKGIKRACGK